MADKDLKSLTLDGVTYRNVMTDSEIGAKYWNPYADVGALTANTWAYSPYLDIPTKGLYLIYVTAQFQTASSTGETTRIVNLETTDGGTASMRTNEWWKEPSSGGAVHTRNYVYKFSQDNGKVRGAVQSTKATPSGTRVTITAVKLAEYPGIEE